MFRNIYLFVWLCQFFTSLIISYKYRLYLHLFLCRCSLFPQCLLCTPLPGIVVEGSSFRGFPADRLHILNIFKTFTLMPISSLCCSYLVFKVFQQLSELSSNNFLLEGQIYLSARSKP